MRVTIDVCNLAGLVRTYCYAVESPDDSVQDANYAAVVISRIAGDDGENRPVKSAPPQDAVPLFRMWIDISNTHKSWTRLKSDYMRFDGCPAVISEHAMAVYRTIRGVLRESKQDYREKRREKKEDK